MPNLNGTVLRLLGVIGLVVAAFLYGQHIQKQADKAAQLDTVVEQFDGFVGKVEDAAKAGTAQGLADLKGRTDTFARISKELRTAKGIMDNAASQLSDSLRGGACILNPEQRRMLECIRRPDTAACTAAVP